MFDPKPEEFEKKLNKKLESWAHCANQVPMALRGATEEEKRARAHKRALKRQKT